MTGAPPPESAAAAGDRPVLALTIAGTVVGLLGGLLTALWEIFLSPSYAGRIPLPASPVLAVFTNVGLVWFVRRVTRRTGLALLPGVVWFGTMVLAASRTHEGDVPLPGDDYMGLLAILLGCAAWAIAGYRIILAARPDLPAPGRAGSTTPAARGAATGPGGTVSERKPAPGGKASPERKPARGGKAAPGGKPAPGGKAAPGGRPAPGTGSAAGGKPAPAARRRPADPSSG
jgi:hypothetical protein